MQGQPAQRFENLDQAARVQTVLAGALIGGVLVFATVASFFRPAEPEITPLTYVLILMVLGDAVAFLIVPDKTASQAINKLNLETETDESLRLALAGVFIQRMIIRMALCEGVAFLAIIVWMIEGNLIAPAVLTVIFVTQLVIFPTRHSLENWIDEQFDRLRAV